MNEQMPNAAEQEMRNAVRYICRGIRSKSARQQAEQEYLEHVEDHYYRLLLRGVPEEKARKQAIEALGVPEDLCHMLAAVHNRLPADLGKNLLIFGIRAVIALYAGCMLWALGLFSSHPIVLLIPILIITGLAPIRYLRALCLRIKHINQIRRVCHQNDYKIEQMASPLWSVVIPARRPEWVIITPKKNYCVHFLACHNRRAALHLLDSYVYALTVTRGQGANFVDRSPLRMNLIKTGDQSYSEKSLRTLYFPVSPDYYPGTMHKILLLNPVPSEISYRKGTGSEYAGNGDTVYGFTVCDGAYFAHMLSSDKS